MIRINQIKIRHDMENIIEGNELRDVLIKHVAKLLRVDKGNIAGIEIIRRSIDARKKPEIFDIYLVDVNVKGVDEKKVVSKCKNKDVCLKDKEEYSFERLVFSILEKKNQTDGNNTGDVRLDSLNIEEIKKKLMNLNDGLFLENDNDSNSNSNSKRIVVIGAGPAGLFCGYMLAMKGFKPLILERGADVDKRTEIVEHFWKTGELDTTTNVQFGEGGAGTFSDGKLNTMVKDKDGRGREALRIFVQNGAQEEIMFDAKPHIGTDVLRNVVRNMREKIIELGGEVRFETQVEELIIDDEGKLSGVKVNNSNKTSSINNEDSSDEKVIPCKMAVLAIGHSARDTFYMLKDKKVSMEKKPFAVGLRVEHPQSLINHSQYGISNPKTLPSAPYKLTTTTESGRGVYSFCMCPGGYVVNASSEEGRLAVNGMSYSRRDGNNANSAIIVTVDPKDFGSDDILSGVEFQRKLEEKAFEIGGGKIPVEYYGDFKAEVIKCNKNKNCQIENKDNKFDLKDKSVEEHNASISDSASEVWPIEPCMRGDYVFADVHEILPDKLNNCFVEGMEKFGRMIKDYNNERTLLSGVESRTSSPVRITRDENCESVNIKGLYPCGEGAGYAGGIMSAAMDGMKVAEHIVAELIAYRGNGDD